MKNKILVSLTSVILVFALLAIWRGRENSQSLNKSLAEQSKNNNRDKNSKSESLLVSRKTSIPEELEAEWQSLFIDYSESERWNYSEKFLVRELEKKSEILFLEEMRKNQEFALASDKIEFNESQETLRDTIEKQFMNTWSQHMERYGFGIETDDWIFLLGPNRWAHERKKFFWISIRKEDLTYFKWDTNNLFLKK